jgi:CDP-paratose 2-epimerase
MMFQHLLITGGAGFVGSNLAIRFRQSFPGIKVLAIDSLKRRGSELSLPRLREAGVDFRHADIRCREDLDELPDFDVLIDCAAEPSVQAGLAGSPAEVLSTNLFGTVQCLELARRRQAAFLFLSTSRVYPIAALNQLPFREDESRFLWQPTGEQAGFSDEGIGEAFTLEGPRSYYGSSKLASELLLQEYVASAGLQALINRCGVLAGPWQMGKVDQGVMTLWVARHHFRRSLRYTGFGGQGKQVRDLLHIEDLFRLLVRQFSRPELWDGRVYNVGGGRQVSLSLRELTEHCASVTGNRVEIHPIAETSPVDIRIYITDNRKVEQDLGWRPEKTSIEIVSDIHAWVREHENALKAIMA